MATVETNNGAQTPVQENASGSAVAVGVENAAVSQTESPALPDAISQMSEVKQQAYQLLRAGKTYREVGKLIDRSPQSVGAYVKEFRDAGISLADRPRVAGGRPKGSTNKTSKISRPAKPEHPVTERRHTSDDLRRALEFAQSFNSLDRAVAALEGLKNLIRS